jgi:hypothetical protein
LAACFLWRDKSRVVAGRRLIAADRPWWRARFRPVVALVVRVVAPAATTTTTAAAI